MVEKIIIDCDTGIDDALALTLALSSNKIDILGVTTVAGNVDCVNTTRNTCNIVNLLGRDDLHVAKGEDKPLEREPFRASGVHGVTGLRGYSFEKDYTDNLLPLHAVEYMKKILDKEDEKSVSIVALGPVTNIAKLFSLYPEVKEKVKKVVFMGTSYFIGNPTPVATFNVLVDPEAFRQLLFSGVEIVSCPLDVTRKAVLNSDDIEAIRALNTTVSKFAMAIIDNYGLSKMKADEQISSENEEVITSSRIANSKVEGVTLHDPATIAYVIAPQLFTTKKYYCDVECKGELTLGATVIDKFDWYRKEESEKNLTLIESIDRDGFAKLFIDAIKEYDL